MTNNYRANIYILKLDNRINLNMYIKLLFIIMLYYNHINWCSLFYSVLNKIMQFLKISINLNSNYVNYSSI